MKFKVIYLFLLLLSFNSLSVVDKNNLPYLDRKTKTTIKVLAYSTLAAVSTWSMLKVATSFCVLPAPWIKAYYGNEFKYREDTKVYLEDKGYKGYKGPVIIHFPGNGDYFQTHNQELQAIHNKTKLPLIAVNYPKIAFSSKSLAKSVTNSLLNTLKTHQITPTEITFLGHSLGAATADLVSGTIQKEFNIPKNNIDIIAFNSFQELHKVANIPKLAFTILGWELDPKGEYKTNVIQNTDDLMMRDTRRRHARYGKTINVYSAENAHMNWQAFHFGDLKTVPILIADIINTKRRQINH